MNVRFALNDVEMCHFECWNNYLDIFYPIAENNIYGRYFTFSFTETGIGVNIIVKDNYSKQECDITDYESW